VNQNLIPFNRPFFTGNEVAYIEDAMYRRSLAGNGFYTNKASEMLRELTGSKSVLLTQSCTAALEMAAVLLDLKLGDEVIMPSYTFVSTANAFVLRGAKPVFVDISDLDLNIDVTAIERAITKNTKVIVVVHYAGVPCDMSRIMSMARAHGIYVIEDAAQAICSSHDMGPLGTIGTFGCLSFHETKNIIAGEGGALLVNDERFIERAEIIWEKGTNRKKFFMGEVDKYTWVDIGSSYLPSEVTAAFLTAQLERATEITTKRREIWFQYLRFFEGLPASTVNKLGMSWYPHANHNGHMFYLILKSKLLRDEFIRLMRQFGVMTVFHYLPLHSSEFGRTLSMQHLECPITDRTAACLVRLPLWPDLVGTFETVTRSIEASLDLLLEYSSASNDT
jgi:dTDP-4-amino-4,6-dideoxygalactose transaminase